MSAYLPPPYTAAEGLVSGYTAISPECDGLTIQTCTRCASSKDPANCRECAKTPTIKFDLLALMSYLVEKADGCSNCYNSPDPATCVDCLIRDAPCAQCALQTPTSDAAKTTDVGACVGCIQKHGGNYRGPCTACANLGNKPQQVKQCMACLNTMKPIACDKLGFQTGCGNPVDTSTAGACASCASQAADFSACVACLQTSPL